ncbi:putative membrane-anchored protein [Evansella vedderi]|uniref:Membrane-anchored protein n=1 Tax=Evansella vedderi TaxID=38282 RepID=A0ABU0A0L6_9BACI|nr:putative cytokinetic ring protein SteA [Evansella vedderi]MDQ0256238.1 putative membrane-anchored protein [Evansella vedderi]
MESIELEGRAYYGRITKQLLHDIPPHSIIIIEHEDIDIVAAEDMVRKNVKGVINTRASMTGKLPRTGVSHLIDHGIPVYDLVSTMRYPLSEPTLIRIANSKAYFEIHNKWEVLGNIFPYTVQHVQEKSMEGNFQFNNLYRKFVTNSFHFANMELDTFIKAVEALPKLTDLEDQCTFVVARGPGVEEDLQIVRSYIKQKPCSIIAVDGASALLYHYNIKPDYIIGDMDSIPKEVFKYSCRYIAHSYMNGTSPGQERLKQLSIPCEAIPFPGLSEDLAIMLAYVSESEHIFTLGCRNSVVELVEKAREGMGSTLLTRMYAGERISDLKAVNHWLSIPNNLQMVREYMLENSLTEEYRVDES